MVLDPLSALSLSGTIVQFIEFGSKLVSRSQELYKSSNGSLSVNEELNLVTETLLKLIAKLRQPQRWEELGTSVGDAYRPLFDLCDGCTKIAEEIVAKLEGLKLNGRPRRWRSLQQAVKLCWNEKDLDALLKRLAILRQSLETQVIVELRCVGDRPRNRPYFNMLTRNTTFRERLDIQSIQSCDRFQDLDVRTKEIITALLDVRATFSSDLKDQINAVSRMLDRMEVVMIDQQDTTRAIVLDTLHQSMESVAHGVLSDVRRLIVGIQNEEEVLRAAVTKQILKNLRFPTLSDRQEAIPEAYGKTFGWIFQPSSNGNDKNSYVKWLSSGSGIYWINGKAGSGKSTLMRYLYRDPRTVDHLKAWSSSTTLCVAAFFFWNSGSLEQRSQNGLLRSLLYEVLRQCPNLIPAVLPMDWAQRYTDALVSVKQNHDIWSLSRLKQAFHLLVHQDVVKVKLTLFIDGLDEYEGDHDEVAQLFESITASPHVKVCLSSRPLLIFEEAFGRSPNLQLQDLTAGDIRQYVTDSLGNHRHFRKLALISPRRTSDLIHDIVKKSDGVFLWVKLVVKSLLSGLSNRDDIQDLQKRVELLPSDLETLYNHMLSCIDPFYARKAAEIFQVERASRQYLQHRGPRTEEPLPLTLMSLWYATNNSDITIISSALLTGAELEQSCKTMDDRLKSQCAGLLETPTSSTDDLPSRKIQYLHRTVREYLERPQIWENLKLRTIGTNFNPNLCMLKSCVLQLKAVPGGQITQSFWRIVLAALFYAYLAGNEMDDCHLTLIDGLDRTVSSHMAEARAGQEQEWQNDWSLHLQYELRRSFLNVAVKFGLHRYVRQKLDHGFEENEVLNGQRFLSHAVNPRPIAYRYPLSAEMVTLLLEHGKTKADPNSGVTDQSPWEEALTYAFEQAYRNFCEPRDSDRLEQIEILTVLLIYGANPKAIVRTRRGGLLSASDVIAEVLKGCVLPQAVELRNFLATRLTEAEEFIPQPRRGCYPWRWTCIGS